VAVSVPFTEFGAATGKAYTINANTPTSHADRPPFVTSFAVRVATITIPVANDAGVVVGSGSMPDLSRIRNVVRAPAYILARPAAAPAQDEPDEKDGQKQEGSDGRSSTNAKAMEASTPLRA
jgi:hypothetical protein